MCRRLQLPLVYEVKRRFPQLAVNGGITDLVRPSQHVDGVMLGRVAYQNPGCCSPPTSLCAPARKRSAPCCHKSASLIAARLCTGEIRQYYTHWSVPRRGAKHYRRI